MAETPSTIELAKCQDPLNSRTGSSPKAAHLDFLTGGGDMSERIRRFDWSQTPLGSIDVWPNSLKTAVSICLNSRFPMVIWWGRELVLLYNEGWRPILGENKDRIALGSPGRVVWSEVWDVLGPMFNQVLDKGEATWSDDGLLLVNRYGYTEEAYFTWSYSPIRSEKGTVEGVFTAVTETTARVIGERRLRTLRELLERTFEQAKTPEQACHAAAETLSRNRYDIPFALIYLLDDVGEKARLIEAIGIEADSAPAPSEINFVGEYVPWRLDEILKSGNLQTIGGLDRKFGPLTAGAWEDDCTREAVVMPLAKAGVQDLPAGFLIAGISPRIGLDEKYRDFLQLAAGHVATAIANARALEEERQRAEKLAELDRAKTTFFSNISHELRTPLTLMLGPTEDALISSRPLAGADLDMVHRNEIRLLKLVNTLLDFSRIEAGRIQASFEPVDLSAFTADLASTFRSAIERAGLQFVVECAPLPHPVYLDREMWEKIILNLLSNAFKCTFDGNIRVNVWGDHEAAHVIISDTGTGISADQLPKLFERFHRIEGARRRTHEGSGIGLALVQELVKMHGGAIHVQSQVDKGTSFEITLSYGTEHLSQSRLTPRQDYKAAPSSSPYVVEAMGWVSGSEPVIENTAHELSNLVPDKTRSTISGRILLVDDNRDMRDYVQRLLGSRFSVVTAGNGREALEIAQKAPPDVILSDIMMPEMNGFELLAAIRAHELLAGVPVILLSARAAEEARVEGLERGADDYLVKPFSARELVARVQTHLELARIRKKAIEATQQNEVRFREIIDALPAAVYTTDAEGRITHFNPAAVEFSGRIPQLGTDRWCVSWKLYRVDGTPLPHEECPMAVALKEGRAIRGQEAIAERPDGSRIWFAPYPTPLRDANGKLVGGINMLVDVTERKRAEQELRQSEEELRLLNSVGATLASELDLKTLVQTVTDAGRKLSGAEFGAFFYNVIDQRGESYMLYTLSGAPPEAFAKFPMPRNTAIFGPTFAGKGTIRLDDVKRDPRYGHNSPYHGMPAGHLPVRSYLAVPVISRSGEVLGGLFYGHQETGVFSERTERLVEGIAKQAAIAIDNARLFDTVKHERAQAIANEERFRAIVETTPECVKLVAADGTLLLMNAPGLKLVGATAPESVLGMCVYDLIAPEHRERFREFNAEICKGTRGSIEFDIIGLDGTRRHMETHAAPMHTADGNIAHLAVTRDISERKRVEDALRRSEKIAAVGRLAATMAHEINNPLESVTNLLFLVRKDQGISERARKQLELADQELDRVAHVARQTLGFYRDNSAPVWFRVSEALEELVEIYSYKFRNREIELVKELDASVQVYASAGEFRQVFSNLMVNAIDALPTIRGKIWIRARQGHEWGNSPRPGVRIAIADTGRGIAPQHRSRIFESFFTTKQDIGTGLGLWLTRTLVEKHGGRIHVRSRTQTGGSGTVFSVFWPIDNLARTQEGMA
jgi:PAS domain S-box-containing protein